MLREGTLLKHGTFIVVSMIGKGGFGEVYLARQPRMDREVAIKVLSTSFADDAEILKRFEREALAAGALLHPNVLPVFDFDYDEGAGAWFLAMQYVPGGRTLRNVLNVPLDPALAARYLEAVAGALDAAHNRGIVHRDVKPANVLLDGDRAILTDFGIAHLGSMTGMTATGLAIGTPTYMSPEQGMGSPVDARSDQYSLAVIAYEMMAGHPPFTGDSLSVVFQHVNKPPPPLTLSNPDLPESVRLVIERGMAKEPERRYGSCGEFAAAFAEAAGIAAPSRRTFTVSSTAPTLHGTPALSTPGITADTLAKPGATLDGADYFGAAQQPVAGTDSASGEISRARTVVSPGPAAPPKLRPAYLWAGGGCAVAIALLAGVVFFARPTQDPGRPAGGPVASPIASVSSPPPGATPRVDQARLEVRSNPAAGILINEESVGRTPREITLDPGEYDLTLVAQSYEDYTQRLNLAAGQRLSLPIDLKPRRNVEVLQVTGKSLGSDPYVDAAELVRLNSPKVSFRVTDDVNAIVYVKSRAFGIRDIAFKITTRWTRAGRENPIVLEGSQEVPKDWEDTFVRACAPALALDARGENSQWTLDILIDGTQIESFEFSIGGGNVANAPVSQCDRTSLPRIQA